MKGRVFVYQGEGVGEHAARLVPEALSQILACAVDAITAAEIQNGAWRKEGKLFVMPGGADLPYHAALTGRGNDQIRAFVEDGGAYVGLCAGGYYGAARIRFDASAPTAIVQDRELRFFPGVAVGPAFGDGSYDPYSLRGARVAALALSGTEVVPVYFNGGCYFEGAEDFPEVAVLARYRELPERPAAVVRCSVGRGVAVLSGVHPEYGAESLPAEVAPEIRSALAGREHTKLFRVLLQACGYDT